MSRVKGLCLSAKAPVCGESTRTKILFGGKSHAKIHPGEAAAAAAADINVELAKAGSTSENVKDLEFEQDDPRAHP